jgi:hypothetical protein|tara:strand:- start:27 stop:545 length:519 start_codon:yes stop_codon:yes gene_type:complete
MSKWKEIETYMEVNPYTGQPVEEDAPANATGVNVAGTGDDSSVVVVRKKKKALIDARSKSYREHRRKLETARAKREERKSKLTLKVQEDIGKFSTIREGVVDDLKSIVKDKQAKSIKFKDGSLKIDLTTANLMLQALDKVKPETKKKILNMLGSNKKSDFLKFHGLVMKAMG